MVKYLYLVIFLIILIITICILSSVRLEKNDKNVLVRPVFRILYGIVSVLGAWLIYGVLHFLFDLWDHNIFGTWEPMNWCISGLSIVFALCLGTCTFYMGFIIAISGKPPKILSRYLTKYEIQS
jgi:hypothetical protein